MIAIKKSKICLRKKEEFQSSDGTLKINFIKTIFSTLNFENKI